MKTIIGKIISILIVIMGVVLLVYPFISEYVFEHRIDSEMNTYQDSMEKKDVHIYEEMKRDAQRYNEELAGFQVQLTDPFIDAGNKDEDIVYEELLLSGDTQIMGYVEIPSISVRLPVYHGTDAMTLERGVGHLEGTSLPVGGKNTHSVLTGHTGLNKARLFTDLEELEEGDMFYIHVLGDILAYQIYEVNTVLPEDTSDLLIRDGEDIVTLVTCTPYGINTHRLLVHGRRAAYNSEIYEEIVASGSSGKDSQWMHAYKKAVFMGIFITTSLFAGLSAAFKAADK